MFSQALRHQMSLKCQKPAQVYPASQGFLWMPDHSDSTIPSSHFNFAEGGSTLFGALQGNVAVSIREMYPTHFSVEPLSLYHHQ